MLQRTKSGCRHAKKERDKIRKYSERIINVEQSTFTPLVFTSAGGMARQSQIFYKRMAELMVEKRGGEKRFLHGMVAM